MTIGSIDDRPISSLLCRVGTRLCALPLDAAVETMRLLPIRPLADAPRFVRGLCIIRGTPVPVVDIGPLFGEQESRAQRIVTLRAGARPIAFLVESVLGVRSLEPGSYQELPPLLRDAGAEAVAAVGTLDAELLLVLHAARIVPDAWLESLDAQRPAS